MTAASLVLGLIFVCLGGALLVIRLYYVWVKGDIWNNMPTIISWAFTVLFAGIAVFSVGLFAGRCPDNCEREYGATPEGTMITGGIVFGMGVILMCCTCCTNQQDKLNRDDKPEPYKYSSGLDFLFLGIGLAVLATQESIGVCPPACGQPAVLYG